jgi:hypothetical protein
MRLFLSPKFLLSDGPIACQDVLLQKSFDLNNKPKSKIRYVCYGLKCCMEARFSKTRSTVTLRGDSGRIGEPNVISKVVLTPTLPPQKFEIRSSVTGLFPWRTAVYRVFTLAILNPLNISRVCG